MCNNTFYLFQASDLLGAIFVFSCRVGWWRSSDEKFFLFTAMTSLIVSLILFITKLLQYSKNVPHWQFICIGFDALWAYFYLISSNIIIKWIRFNSDRLFEFFFFKRTFEFWLQIFMWRFGRWSVFWLPFIDLLSGWFSPKITSNEVQSRPNEH